jgi:hypothetical protein
MPVPRTRHFDSCGTDAALNLSFGWITVAHNALSSGIILWLAILVEKKPTSASKTWANNLRAA